MPAFANTEPELVCHGTNAAGTSMGLVSFATQAPTFFSTRTTYATKVIQVKGSSAWILFDWTRQAAETLVMGMQVLGSDGMVIEGQTYTIGSTSSGGILTPTVASVSQINPLATGSFYTVCAANTTTPWASATFGAATNKCASVLDFNSTTNGSGSILPGRWIRFLPTLGGANDAGAGTMLHLEIAWCNR